MAQTARTIRVTIDPSGSTKGAGVVKSELRGIADAARNTTRSQSELTKAANDNGVAHERQARSVNESSEAMDRLNGFIKVFVGLAAIKAVIGLADGFTRFTNSLRVAGVEGVQQRVVIDRLYESAQKYGVQLEAMGGLYGKASQAQKSLNASQADLLKFSNGVAAALKVQGGSVNDAAGALHQLGQAITGNKIQAEEYNSILDGAYPILQAVAAGSDKYRGSVAALTADVKKGNVASKQFFEDFLKGSASLEARAAKANFTVASSWQVLTNATQKYIGEADQANAVTGTLGAGIRGLGQNLETVVPIVAGLGLALGVGFVVRAAAAATAATGAATAMGGMAVAARAAGASLMAAFGGPIGLAVTGLSVLLIGLYNDSQNMQAAFEANAVAAEQYGVKLSEASQAAMAASGETRAVGTSAASAEPEIWSFANASGNLTKQLWEQARAARAARVELLMSQKAEAEKRIMTGAGATWEGSRANSRNSNDALMKGDIMKSASLGWDSIVSDVRYVLSGGRTDREGRALVADSGKVAGAIQKELDKLTGTPIGQSDLPSGGGTPSPTGTPTKKPGGGKSSAASEAERKAKAQTEFWKGLERELDLSTLTTAQGEIRRKQIEIEELTGKKIVDIEAQRVAAGEKTLAQLMEAAKVNQFITQANEANRQSEISIQAEREIQAARMKGLSEEQFAAEKAEIEFKSRLLTENIKLDEAALATQVQQVRQRAQENAELEKRNRLLTDGKAAAEKYSAGFAKSQQARGFANEREALTALYDGGRNPEFTKEQFDQAVKGLGRAMGDAALESKYHLLEKWGTAIDQLAYDFGGKFGKVFGKLAQGLNSLVSAFKGDVGGAGPLGSIATLLGKETSGAFSEASKGFLNDLGSQFGSLFGKGGDFSKTLGSALGAANAGMQVGAVTGSIMKGLGIKTSSTGAQLGGAAGSMIGGPIGSIVGSILGGVVGGMFKKAKWGTASVVNGQVGVGGNKSAYKDNASTAANSITGGLSSIADQLGVDADGNYSVSVGQYKGAWRVSNNGRTGKLKGKYGDVTDFGKDGAEAALQFAIADAIRDGALTGLRATTKTLLSAGDDIQAQLDKALKFESVFKDLKSRLNPVGAAIDNLNLEFKSLTKVFKEAGATSAEYAQLEELRTLKMKEALDSQLSEFQNTLKLIRGDASGKSQLALLNEDMATLKGYRATIAGGGTVDSNKFNELVQSIVGRAGDIYGTQTTQYQNIIGDMDSLVENAMGNVQSEWDKAAKAAGMTTSAVDNMNDQVTARLDTTNDWLAIIARSLGGQALGGSSRSAVSGKLLDAN